MDHRTLNQYNNIKYFIIELMENKNIEDGNTTCLVMKWDIGDILYADIYILNMLYIMFWIRKLYLFAYK